MEQKRTMTSDEANGHDNTGNSHISNSQLKNSPRMRRKLKNHRPKISKNNALIITQMMVASVKTTIKSYNPDLALIRPLSIPEVFIKKPSPIISHRTGKVWSCKISHDAQKSTLLSLESLLDSNLLDKTLPLHRQSKKRTSWLGKDISQSAVIDSDDTVLKIGSHSASVLTQTSNPTISHREFPCVNCLINVGYVSYVTRNELLVDKTLHSLLNDFLHSSSFQHVLFC